MKSKSILNGRTIGVAVLIGLLVGAVISDAQVIRGAGSSGNSGGLSGSGTTNTLAAWSSSTVLSAATSSTTGYGIGGAGADTARLRIIGSFSYGTGASEIAAFHIGGTHTLTGAGLRGSLIRLSGAIVEHSSGSPTYITAIDCNPTFTNGGATTTTASCLHSQTFTAPAGTNNAANIYIANAPTAATNNYAIWVDNGNNRLDGGTQLGSASLTLTDGTLGITKITTGAAAPGAGGGRVELVCGTNAGTAKLIIYAGTSTTPVTITDNIGTGVTGC